MNSNTLLLVIILIAALLSLVTSIIAFLNSQKALQKSKHERIKAIGKEGAEAYVHLHLNQMVANAVHEEMLRKQFKSTESCDESKKPFEPVSSDPVNNVSPVTAVPEQETDSEKKDIEIPLPDPVTFYTGICKEGAFKHVTSVPDNKTVFTIYAESKDAVEGILNVDLSAYDKIALTPDYLQNACVYSGNGTQLKVIKAGTVVKENGTWVVKEPIVAELN